VKRKGRFEKYKTGLIHIQSSDREVSKVLCTWCELKLLIILNEEEGEGRGGGGEEEEVGRKVEKLEKLVESKECEEKGFGLGLGVSNEKVKGDCLAVVLVAELPNENPDGPDGDVENVELGVVEFENVELGVVEFENGKGTDVGAQNNDVPIVDVGFTWLC